MKKVVLFSFFTCLSLFSGSSFAMKKGNWKDESPVDSPMSVMVPISFPPISMKMPEEVEVPKTPVGKKKKRRRKRGLDKSSGALKPFKDKAVADFRRIFFTDLDGLNDRERMPKLIELSDLLRKIIDNS